MRRIFITFIVILLSQSIYGQVKATNNKQEIQMLLKTFMECFVKKDSTLFYSLFLTDPVVWIGVTQEKSYADELKKNSSADDFFSANYKSFYRHFYPKNVEEKFYNIQIDEDGYIASVTFDYSFWESGKKINWGKESWAVIKTKGKWKISSVIFSLEDETINPEPKSRTKH